MSLLSFKKIFLGLVLFFRSTQVCKFFSKLFVDLENWGS